MKKTLISLIAFAFVSTAIVAFVVSQIPESTDTTEAEFRFTVTALGDTVNIAKMTFSTSIKGSGKIIDQTLYRNGAVSKATLTRSERQIAVDFTPEDRVAPDSPNNYILKLKIVDFAKDDTVTVSLLDDSATSPEGKQFIYTGSP